MLNPSEVGKLRSSRVKSNNRYLNIIDVPDGVELRPVPGFDGYFAGSDGTIWSNRNAWNSPSFLPHKKFITRSSRGYGSVVLCSGGKKITEG